LLSACILPTRSKSESNKDVEQFGASSEAKERFAIAQPL
jgi:hypothetical protein